MVETTDLLICAYFSAEVISFIFWIMFQFSRLSKKVRFLLVFMNLASQHLNGKKSKEEKSLQSKNWLTVEKFNSPNSMRKDVT